MNKFKVLLSTVFSGKDLALNFVMKIANQKVLVLNLSTTNLAFVQILNFLASTITGN